MIKEGQPIPDSVREIVKYLGLENISGFDAPTCYRAEPNWVAKLLDAQYDGHIDVHCISVGIRGNRDYEANTIAVQKKPPYGEPTFLCTTGNFAGFLAYPVCRTPNQCLTQSELEEDELPWAFLSRPLLSHTSETDPDVELNLRRYINHGVLRVSRPIEQILQSLNVPLDADIFRANIKAFTQLEAASMVQYTL